MSFVRAANPIWYMVDHAGLSLNDEYFAFFLTNTLPYLPQNVYRDPQGLTVWTGDVVQFQPSGTLPNNLYFDPTLVYRIEIRHGNSQLDELVWEINNFVPQGGESIQDQTASFSEGNQISNSRFSHVSFGNGDVIDTAGTYDIAPDYQLVLTGSGTTTLNQLTFTGTDAAAAGTSNNTQVTYYISIANTGWSTAVLRQRFENNGWIWRFGAVSASLTARAVGTPENIAINWIPSSGTGVQIAGATLGTGNFEVVQGVINLTDAITDDNPDNATVAFLDASITLPVNGTVELTNFQIIGQTNALINPTTAPIPLYEQETEERILDHLFNYYYDASAIKPKKSILVGWNFPLNPYQFVNATLSTKVGPVSYIADQTILYQEAASQLQSGKGLDGDRHNLSIKAVTGATATRFALIQYIDQLTIKPYWSYILSSLVRSRIFTNVGTQVRLKVRLIYRDGEPPTISATEPIASWPANSDPVFAAGWTALAPNYDAAYTLPNNYSTDETDPNGTEYPAFPYNGFQLPYPNSNPDERYLGIVVYTMDNLNSTAGNEDFINFDRISLIPAFTAADAWPQTFDDCLRECQYYYEKSYIREVIPGSPEAVTTKGENFAKATIFELVGNTTAYISSFELQYKQFKRRTNSVPLITFYAPSGTFDAIYLDWAVNGVPQFSSEPSASNNFSITIGDNSAIAVALHPAATASGASAVNQEARMFYQYTIDSTLGGPV